MNRSLRFNLWSRIMMTGTLLMTAFASLKAQRVPVLSQIDLPHAYYYRELYLPQLTAGPSSVDWLPDGSGIIFSMGGSLWRHAIGSVVAEQLTDGDGYDHQPDVSPDGRQVIFTRYTGQAMELQLLDLASRQVSLLTSGKAVNLEPRWSPDGGSVVYVSTAGSRHFLLYRAKISKGVLGEITCLTPDHKSEVKRYYYSSWDHAINPVFTPDGKSVVFVSNKEIAHGTGDLVRMDLTTLQTVNLHHEETNWRARPDVSPDGTRIVYSSYSGRNHHQLWLLPTGGGFPFALTYGEYDNFSPRWSPDGRSIAFISNRDGVTAIWIAGVMDGKQQQLKFNEFRYLKPRQELTVVVNNERGEVIPARVSVVDARGKFHSPAGVRIHADDASYPAQYKFEHHYFHTTGQSALKVPQERLVVTVSHGPFYALSKVNVDATKPLTEPVKVTLEPFNLPNGFSKGISGDLHVHMNYGGHYLNKPSDLLQQAAAEDVNLVFNLIVNKEQRVPDVQYFGSGDVRSTDGKAVVLHSQEFHTSFWGHMGLLNLSANLILPDYAGYPQTAAESLYPDNTFIAEEARKQGGLAGYVHPFEVSEVMPQPAPALVNELPVSAALGLVDYYELIGFADHRASEKVWHQLLNCGLRIPAGAGTDLMANYASLRGPLGLNRVVARMEGLVDKEAFLRKVKDGASYVTNGPVIGLMADGKQSGETLVLGQGGGTISYQAFLRSQVPLDFFEVLWNGEVVARHTLIDTKKFADVTGKLKVKGPGWLLLRAGSTAAHPDLPDLYPFASTNPIWVETPEGSAFRSKEAAAWFLPWLGQIDAAVKAFKAFRTEQEREIILERISTARGFYQGIINQKK